MSSIGDQLRRERQRRGLKLEHVAAETKIGLHLLEAMEADQFDRLPGGVFTRSFLRQYAHSLGLDQEEIVAALKQQFEEPADSPPPPEPAPPARHIPTLPPLEDVRDRLRSDSSLGAFVWVVLAILLCAGAYSMWQKRSRNATETVAAVPQALPRAHQPAEVKRTPPPAPTAAAPKPEFRPAVISDNGTITVPAAPKPGVPKLEPPPPDSARPMRVAFTATEPVWVSIKSDGTRTYSGTIEVQQGRQFDADRKMTVLVGNAGALRISLNGKPVGPIGPHGEIRLLVLTPAGAHVVPRTPPTPPPTSVDSTAAPEGEGTRP